MFAATFALAFVVAHVAGEIPSYIHICGRRNPNIDKCISENVNNLKSKLCEGMPELDVQPLDSLHIDKMDVINTDNAKLIIYDVLLMGFCDFDIKSFHLNLENLHFDADIIFRRINISMIYNFDANLIVHVALKGPFHVFADNVLAKAAIDMKLVNKDSKEHVYLSNIKLDLDIKDYEVDLSSSNEVELDQLREISRNFVIQNKQDVIKAVKSMIEENAIKHIFNFSNKIVQHFTYDELFPDRE